MKTNYKQLMLTLSGATACFIVLILTLGPANLRVVTGIYMWIGLALSWNIIGGYCGYLSFGHSAFFGIGAYVTAILMGSLHMPFWVGFISAPALSAVVALLIGIPTLRLSGAYFAIGTWAVALMLLELSQILKVTGGAYGLYLPPVFDGRVFNTLMFVIACGVFTVCWWKLEHGGFGRKLEAIRENETAANMLGIDVTREKLRAFVLSAIFPGIIGSVFAVWISFINPMSVFGPRINTPMVLMAILGGLGTLFGPVIAAIVLYLVDQTIWINFGSSSGYLILLGSATCLVVLFAPDGLVSIGGLVKHSLRRRFNRVGPGTQENAYDEEKKR